MKDNLVSIIMPCYNSSRYISDSIISVQKQTYHNWELLIVDDCSKDNSVELIKQFCKYDNRIKLYLTLKNGGAGVARNIAIREAKGDYLAFIDSDDWWYPNKLEIQISFMQENKYDFTFSEYEDCDEQLKVLHLHKQKSRVSYSDLSVECSIGTPGAIFCIKNVGKFFMPETRRSEDWALWLKVVERTGYAYSISKPLWKYRHIAGSASSSKFGALKDIFSMYRNNLNFSLIKSWYYLLIKMLPRYIFKKLVNSY